DRLRYLGRGCPAGTSSLPSSLTSFARGGWVGPGHLGSADDWVKTSSRIDFKCWTEVDEYLPTRDADEYPFRRSVARHGRSSPETYSLLMPAIRARLPSVSCPDLLMRRRRVDEAAHSRTGPRRPRRGYRDNIPAHTQYQGGLPNRLPGVDDRGNSGRRVPRRHYPTISYPCDKNTHQNNTPSGEHSENIYQPGPFWALLLLSCIRRGGQGENHKNAAGETTNAASETKPSQRRHRLDTRQGQSSLFEVGNPINTTVMAPGMSGMDAFVGSPHNRSLARRGTLRVDGRTGPGATSPSPPVPPPSPCASQHSISSSRLRPVSPNTNCLLLHRRHLLCRLISHQIGEALLRHPPSASVATCGRSHPPEVKPQLPESSSIPATLPPTPPSQPEANAQIPESSSIPATLSAQSTRSERTAP
ncbi:hypothetical protein THAOC_26134, partial [Thalassiosira oceanica]